MVQVEGPVVKIDAGFALAVGRRRPRRVAEKLRDEVLPFLARRVGSCLEGMPLPVVERLEEIRLRLWRPLMVVMCDEDLVLRGDGRPASEPADGYVVTDRDILETLELVSDSSIYALEEELRHGFVTLRGGHRVGLAGRVMVENGRVKGIKQVSGFNVRVSREVPGAADPILGYVLREGECSIYNTLIVSPPRCGKTTILRDLLRQLSDGTPWLGRMGLKVGVVDERSEIAACLGGVPQNDVGVRTDVLDGCPKALGMMMLLRSLSPDVIGTDEIGSEEDARAIGEAVNAGVRIVATAHASTVVELERRASLRGLMRGEAFQRIVFLGRSRGVGSLEAILDAVSFERLA